MKVDRLKLSLGQPFYVGDYYIVHPLTIEEITDIGYKEWGHMMNVFLLSWDDLKIDIDAEEQTDENLYQLIYEMYIDEKSDEFFKMFNKACKLILKRVLVKSKVDLYTDKNNSFRKVKDFFTKEIYGKIRKIVKSQNLINKDSEKEKHNFANKQAEELYNRIKKNQKIAEKYKDKPELCDLVSALRWKSSLPKKEIMALTLYELYDGLYRNKVIENVDNVNYGIYSGSIKFDDIDKKELDWMKKLEINN